MSQQRPLRLAVFDLDGTVIDSRANIIRAVEAVAGILGLPTPPDIPRVIGLSLDVALARLFPEVDAAVHQRLEDNYRQTFQRMRASPGYEEPLFPGAMEAFAQLDEAGILMGIATGKAQRGVNHFLERHGLVGRFVTMQTPDIAPGKPHPGMLLQAMAHVGAQPHQTVMIGDTSYDIEMARSAGVGAIGVSWGNHPIAELKAAGAHRLVDRLDEVLQAVNELTAPVPAKV